ncbi:WhiB family transcriptional regulator, partial [Streptomyces sp. NPDC058409]|uniref:WhiB family transcriptional regulator n=1 Tax=Streptomyces sp. NPDC058409 TaxID=3346484 RepID=UPI0036641576
MDLDQSWRDHALCTQADPKVFFPEKGASNANAKRVCDVRAQCLTEARINLTQATVAIATVPKSPAITAVLTRHSRMCGAAAPGRFR